MVSVLVTGAMPGPERGSEAGRFDPFWRPQTAVPPIGNCGCADIFLEAQHRPPPGEKIARKSDRAAFYESDELNLPGRNVHVMFYESEKTEPVLLVSRYA
jgi:hypothetical protein